MSRVLSDKKIGGYEVTKVTNAEYHIIGEKVGAFLADLSPEDTALIYFSCHGLRGHDGELYFAAINTREAQLEDTSLPASRLARQLDRSPCRQVALVLDCCFSGAFSRSFLTSKNSSELSETIRHNLQGEGRAILTATTSTQVAYEHLPDDGSSSPVESIFTRVLVEGLETGDADFDRDGIITVSELFKYMYHRIHSQQTPTLSVIAQQGEMIIANSSKHFSLVQREVPSVSQFTELLPIFLENLRDANKHSDDHDANSQEPTGLTAGLTTGLTMIDRHTSGINKGEVWLISSTTPVICNAFVRRMAAAQAFNTGVSVGLLSFDEDVHSTISRLVAARTGLRLDAISSRSIDAAEWAQLSQEVDKIADSRLTIVDLMSTHIETRDVPEILKREIGRVASILIAGGEFMAEMLASARGAKRTLLAIRGLARESNTSVVLSVAADDAEFWKLYKSCGRLCDIILRPVVNELEEAFDELNQHVNVRIFGLRGNPNLNYHANYEPGFDRLSDDERSPSRILAQIDNDTFDEMPPWEPEEEPADDEFYDPTEEQETLQEFSVDDETAEAREKGAEIIYALSSIISESDVLARASVARDLEDVAHALDDSPNNSSISWWKSILEPLLRGKKNKS
jgi:hypothetical protein